MGGYLSKSFTRAQAEMMEKQKETMRENMNRQMRIMQARFAAINSYFRKGFIPDMIKPPLFIGSIVTAYQVDFAYFNKSDRIREEYYNILENEDHWFSLEEREYIKKNNMRARPLTK
ncbi:hypothetical protein O9G_002680 [Rozella allomycis CSF55]|uniref:Uncharacterized protein n=1 Tax=Rozella allomycis (strain CSF55) TaxID=988480 RepID=A0A075B4B9_ROZAC|nr:hypothetical protein O9G_002680 [Rozella allomycis CSF55]|eukprot:EPZ36037.1 hypothetical protein O9G_002680 [Rozella allomycis CSF55]